MDTFRWLAVETAAVWQYAYPEAAERETTNLVVKTIDRIVLQIVQDNIHQLEKVTS